MDSKFNTALQAICAGNEPAAMVTITQVKGSTPRKPGAKMLILADGQTFGTIGGGCGEAEVRREALEVLASGHPKQYLVNMTNDMAAEEGMVCGGIMEVFIDYLSPQATWERELLSAYLTAISSGEQPVLVTVLAGPCLSQKLYLTADGKLSGTLASAQLSQAAVQYAAEVRTAGKPKVLTIDTVPLYFEPNPVAVQLLILGAGHIALPLATMAKLLGYQVTVVDDRPSFANQARFPDVDRVICNDFASAIKAADINHCTYVVIVTRGHRHDKVCLQAVLDWEPGYIGMIGSRRRVKALLSELEESGVSPTRLQAIHSPIGLDIQAETPEEIAVSILAELIKTHRGGQATSLKLTKWN